MVLYKLVELVEGALLGQHHQKQRGPELVHPAGVQVESSRVESSRVESRQEEREEGKEREGRGRRGT